MKLKNLRLKRNKLSLLGGSLGLGLIGFLIFSNIPRSRIPSYLPQFSQKGGKDFDLAAVGIPIKGKVLLSDPPLVVGENKQIIEGVISGIMNAILLCIPELKEIYDNATIMFTVDTSISHAISSISGDTNIVQRNNYQMSEIERSDSVTMTAQYKGNPIFIVALKYELFTSESSDDVTALVATALLHEIGHMEYQMVNTVVENGSNQEKYVYEKSVVRLEILASFFDNSDNGLAGAAKIIRQRCIPYERKWLQHFSGRP